MDDWVCVGYGDIGWMIGCVCGIWGYRMYDWVCVVGYGDIGWMIECVCGGGWGYRMDDWVCVGMGI